MGGRLQNEDHKSEAELISSGGAKSQLLNDTKIYVTSGGINKTLDDAITDGDIGGGGSGLLIDITTKSASYTVLDGDGFTTILVDDTTSDRTITLPTAADNGNRQITVKNISDEGNKVIIDGEGAETIDGQTTFTLASKYDEVTVQCNGAAWFIIETKPRVAYVKDVQTSGTNGGTFTQGAWQTRALNTLEGDTSFISLSGNRVTLEPGLYGINGSATSNNVTRNQAKLVGDPGGTPFDAILGTCEWTYPSSASSFIKGKLEITSTTTYELQHYGLTTSATIGFGRALGIGNSEVYSQIEITKLR